MAVMGRTFFDRPLFHLMGNHIGDLQRQFFSLFHRLFQFFVHFFRQAGLHDRIVKYIFSENLNHVYILTHFSYPFRLTPISISMFPLPCSPPWPIDCQSVSENDFSDTL